MSQANSIIGTLGTWCGVLVGILSILATAYLANRTRSDSRSSEADKLTLRKKRLEVERQSLQELQSLKELLLQLNQKVSLDLEERKKFTLDTEKSLEALQRTLRSSTHGNGRAHSH